MKLRPAKERGSANYGWLEARYTFSFGEYYDPTWMGWRCLRVMNEDRISGNTGFPSHPHREMEIITFMLKGALSHEDSAGGSGVIRENEVQVITDPGTLQLLSAHRQLGWSGGTHGEKILVSKKPRALRRIPRKFGKLTSRSSYAKNV